MAKPDVRKRNLSKLTKLGFKVAPGLPFERDAPVRLRPAVEIASRLTALSSLFMWVSVDQVEDKVLRQFALANDLVRWLSDEERKIFKSKRDKARAHEGTIGWRLENMWPLAWILGFKKEPPVDGEMIPRAIIEALLFDFLPGPASSVKAFVKGAKLREGDEVFALEDLFYCAHNAVRSAQLGGKTVPKGFDPVGNGGVIHERRHSLTWALSPKVDWDDTDLST